MMEQTKIVDPKGIVGRGVADGARLSREWFAELTELAKKGGTAAYCFVNGNLIEILRPFDIPVTFPKINSLQTAFRQVSRSYLDEAEDYGYSPDICVYVKIGVAIQRRNGEHPMGWIPKPKLSLLNNSCNIPSSSGAIYGSVVMTPPLSASTSCAWLCNLGPHTAEKGWGRWNSTQSRVTR